MSTCFAAKHNTQSKGYKVGNGNGMEKWNGNGVEMEWKWNGNWNQKLEPETGN